jgi:hypothetical protein
MLAYDSRTKLEALRDHFETLSRAGNYLLVGHSARLVGCLSVLKDHPDKLPDRLQGVSALVLLFGSGLLFGMLNWGTAMAIKIKVTQLIISETPPSRAWIPWLYRKFIELLAHFGLWGSLVTFVVAIILIMSHFTDALPSQFLRILRGV